MTTEMVDDEYRRLPVCSVDAEKLDIIFPCDGAASVGQVGNRVAIDLTNAGSSARMCCTTAVGAGSEQHVGIGKRARRVIVINGCTNRCASKIMEQRGIEVDHEYIIAKMGVNKKPTLDFNDADVERISAQIAQDIGLEVNNSIK
ncbi:MAG: putative zinc-binding protein [Anaerolineales bacterium]